MPVRPTVALLALTLSACGTSSGVAYGPPADVSASEVVVVEGGVRGRSEAGVPPDRRVVRTASVALRVRRGGTPEALAAARARAEGLGGFVAVERTDELVLRVPDPQLTPFLDGLAGLGRVAHRDVQAQDVTDAYADLEARAANARRTRERLLALLERAETVPDVLAVERELARVTAEVEVLEGNLDRLRQTVALAAVSLRVGEPVRLGPVGYLVVGVYEAVRWLVAG